MNQPKYQEYLESIGELLCTLNYEYDTNEQTINEMQGDQNGFKQACDMKAYIIKVEDAICLAKELYSKLKDLQQF